MKKILSLALAAAMVVAALPVAYAAETCTSSDGQHIWDEGWLYAAPTCDAKGITEYTCTICGETKQEYEPEAYGHTEGEAVIENGYSVIRCAVCNETISSVAVPNETDHSNGTQITMIGTQEEAAGGAGDVYTVTVPAKMVPGDTGTVKAEGTWAAHKFLNVYCPQKVTLTYGAQSMDVAITGGHFSLIGNSVDPVSKEVEISVEDATRLFGTWEGVIEYDVRLVDKGDANGDGVIDQADVDFYTGLSSQEPEIVARADIDGNGWANTTDLGLLLQVRQGNVITPGNFKS